jgi:hypothetical protein
VEHSIRDFAMTSKYTKTVTVSARRYQDYDDSLSAAAFVYADEHGLDWWQVTAAWVGGEDGEREEIELTVPTGHR